jgi:hypothetical protein
MRIVIFCKKNYILNDLFIYCGDKHYDPLEIQSFWLSCVCDLSLWVSGSTSALSAPTTAAAAATTTTFTVTVAAITHT